MHENRVIKILEIVRRDGSSTIQELSAALHVSISTIRRDIAELAQRNLVAYNRNVIVPISEKLVDEPLRYRSGVNTLAKQAIAREAFRLVKNGDTVFLDSSSTVLAMASMLNGLLRLTIVTNGLRVVPRIQNSDFTVHVIGGKMSRRSHGFYGPLTETALRRFNFDIAFFSPVAVTPQNFAAETSPDAASVRQVAMAQAKRSVLMFDHTKIGQTRTYNFASLDDFNYLITDDRQYHFDTSAAVLRAKN
ncbi:MAG: DeoR/GlpR family DNA-binding transcription regulator [Clostridiales bacterium]|nr:DeoR/GlpR family DNA-binding transcription regulator [Clostridiales bacterium]